jgi:heat shock protein HslJ
MDHRRQALAWTFAVLPVLALLAACAAPQGASPPATPIPLTGSEWILSSLAGDELVEGSTVTIAFYEGPYLEGSAGCNSYGADYVAGGQQFQVAEIHRTSRACDAPAGVMEQETAYLEALKRIAVHRATEDRLEFADADGRTILAYDRKRPPAVDPALQGTEWLLVQLRGRDPIPGTHVELALGAEGFGGFAGCNRYGGEYEAASEGEFRPGLFTITAMDCALPPGVQEQENAYVQALREAATYRLDGDRLGIQDTTGEIILAFVRQQAYHANPSDLPDTAWQLVSLDGASPAGEAPVTLAFHDEQWAGGSAGCRGYVVSYQAGDGDLHFLSTTMLGAVCPEKDRLVQEGTYTTILGWTEHYRLSEGQLELVTSRGETLVFEPVPTADQPAVEGPTWSLLAFIEPNAAEGLPVPHPLAREVLSGTEISLVLEGGTARGSAGCNTYGGAYSLNGQALTFGDLYSTEMACLDPAGVMDQEQRYLDLLRTVATAHVYGRQLWLEAGEGRALVFVAR